jgi:hypothetical protein
LADDLEQGLEPHPRCAAEEWAMHLALRTLPAALDDQWWGPELFDGLPEHEDDLDVNMLLEMLFQDHDILQLTNADLDGIEDPENELNADIGMGDYRPGAWYQWFNNAQPRDGRRPFRR